MGRARRRVRPAANTLEERGAERDRAGGEADRRRARAIRAVGVVVEQHLVDDVNVALARQYIHFLEAGCLPDAILDLDGLGRRADGNFPVNVDCLRRERNREGDHTLHDAVLPTREE